MACAIGSFHVWRQNEGRNEQRPNGCRFGQWCCKWRWRSSVRNRCCLLRSRCRHTFELACRIYHAIAQAVWDESTWKGWRMDWHQRGYVDSLLNLFATEPLRCLLILANLVRMC
eukprot:3232245-Amphidinium_carterae.1